MALEKKEIYHAPQWLAFRKRLLHMDNDQCSHCAQSSAQRILQVHHKYYIPGRLPWQYPPKACLVLCRSCHAQLHGKVQPRKGWQYMGHDYCRKGKVPCENCQTKIKHCFLIFHPQWGTLQVGTICCDRLTTTTYATEQRNLDKKRAHYFKSIHWQKTERGNKHRRYKGRHILVFKRGGAYFLKIEETFGHKKFATPEEAQNHAFTIIHDGRLRSYELAKPVPSTILPLDI